MLKSRYILISDLHIDELNRSKSGKKTKVRYNIDSMEDKDSFIPKPVLRTEYRTSLWTSSFLM